jgi:hypothetical protein
VCVSEVWVLWCACMCVCAHVCVKSTQLGVLLGLGSVATVTLSAHEPHVLWGVLCMGGAGQQGSSP